MTDHKDARQLLADITAGLEGVTPGPWLVKTHDQWEAGFDFFEGPDGAFCFYVDLEEPDAAHIARCNPANMQTIDREFTALTLELASAMQRIAELEAALEQIDISAHAGLCYYTLGSIRAFHEDIRKIARAALPASPHEGTQS